MEGVTRADILWILFWDIPRILILGVGLAGLLWFGFHALNLLTSTFNDSIMKLRKKEPE